MTRPPSPGADHGGQLIQAEAQRQCGAQALGGDEVGDDRRDRDVLHGARPGHQRPQHVEHRHRRRAGEGERRERAGAQDQRDLVEQEQAPAIDSVGHGAAEQRAGHERHELDRSE
jgi:hypothetical protein